MLTATKRSLGLQVVAQATGNPNDSAGAGVEVALEEASGNLKTANKSDQPKVSILFRPHKIHSTGCLGPCEHFSQQHELTDAYNELN